MCRWEVAIEGIENLGYRQGVGPMSTSLSRFECISMAVMLVLSTSSSRYLLRTLKMSLGSFHLMKLSNTSSQSNAFSHGFRNAIFPVMDGLKPATP